MVRTKFSKRHAAELGWLAVWVVVWLVAGAVVCKVVQTACPAKKKDALFGGTTAAPDRYPWFCFFAKKNSTHPGCGGALIAPDTVLTASHCNIQVNDLVYIGGPAGDPGTDVRAVKMTTVHPGFDLRLVSLYTPSSKRPIKLATTLPPNNTPVVLIGRGRKNGNREVINHDLTTVHVRYVDGVTAANMVQQEAEYAWKADIVAAVKSPAIITTFSPDKGGCSGDSGGPVIIDRGKDAELLGIIAFIVNTGDGRRCELAQTKHKYTFCTSIPHYLGTKSRVQEVVGRMAQAKCRFVNRQPDGTCPGTHPWDAGVVHNPKLAYGYMEQKCTSNEPCAWAMADFYALTGARVIRKPTKTAPAKTAPAKK